MKLKIPIAAISVEDIVVHKPTEFPELLADETLIDNLIVDLQDIAGEVAYLLVMQDEEKQINYPAFAKCYEVVSPPDEEAKTEGNIKYRKIAEYDSESFEVEFDVEGLPVNIVVRTVVN